MSSYSIISADSHFVEPPKMWGERLDKKFPRSCPTHCAWTQWQRRGILRVSEHQSVPCGSLLWRRGAV